MNDAAPHLVVAPDRPTLMPTPSDWLLWLPLASMLGVWALYLSPVGAHLIGWGALPGPARWQSWGLQLLPLAVAIAVTVRWLAANRWDWTNLGLRPMSLRWMAGAALVGLTLAVVNTTVMSVVVPAWGGSYGVLYDSPHAQAVWWVMLFAIVPAVAVVVEVCFRGFLLGRLLVWLPAGGWGRWGAILVAAWLFAWDPFLVFSFREFHWLGLTDGIVWGYLFVRSGSLLAPMLAHGVEVGLLYGCFRWVLA
jgi:membrane protease YdiL (CAAX protease family)